MKLKKRLKIRLIIALILGVTALIFSSYYLTPISKESYSKTALYWGFPIGVGVFLLFMGLTSKSFWEAQKRKSDRRYEEWKQNRNWRREAFHKESGRMIAQERYEKDRKARIREERDSRRAYKKGMKILMDS